jgi:hypothetical protein
MLENKAYCLTVWYNGKNHWQNRERKREAQENKENSDGEKKNKGSILHLSI